ncbi:MAG: hypothetical protein BWX80_02694 [Candidatus Hydrogenedentes bacterium ADurb.Bin101]|jgi:hypothetical protein|nr:MAG: hypothetical protein BWX80_02694 [Candidatus Hydrogenedentes bacterium ADurb.Bin101]
MRILWTDYMRYRATLRGFDLEMVERIVRYSTERYLDHVTGSHIAVGPHEPVLIMIAYETENDSMTPITVHATTRAQIKARLKSGRFTHE